MSSPNSALGSIEKTAIKTTQPTLLVDFLIKLLFKMGFGNESDDDLIVIEDGPKKNVLPTDKEIDEKLRIWVDDEVQKGNDPKDMKLMVLLKVKQFQKKSQFSQMSF